MYIPGKTAGIVAAVGLYSISTIQRRRAYAGVCLFLAERQRWRAEQKVDGGCKLFIMERSVGRHGERYSRVSTSDRDCSSERRNPKLPAVRKTECPPVHSIEGD